MPNAPSSEATHVVSSRTQATTALQDYTDEPATTAPTFIVDPLDEIPCSQVPFVCVRHRSDK
jgi:hypothetical protein